MDRICKQKYLDSKEKYIVQKRLLLKAATQKSALKGGATSASKKIEDYLNTDMTVTSGGETYDFTNLETYSFDKKLNWSNFDYPIDSFLRGDGCWSIKRADDLLKNEKIDNFDMMNHKKYEKVYFFEVGENNEDPWIFLAKHKNGFFVYFFASCSYSGFNSQGGGELRYSKNKEKIWKYALDEYTRYKIKLDLYKKLNLHWPGDKMKKILSDTKCEKSFSEEN